MEDEKTKHLNADIKEIKETQQAIYKILNGNGHIGLVTRVALVKESLVRAWITLTLLITGVVGVAFYIIKCGLSGEIK